MKPLPVVAICLILASGFSAISHAAGPIAATAPAGHLAVGAAKPATARIEANYGKLPLSFEANQGQSDPQVRFLSRGYGYSLFLTDSAAVLALNSGDPASKKLAQTPAAKGKSRPETAKTDVVRMELAGANLALKVSGAEQLPGAANYFIGKDPSKWQSNVPTYAKVKYTGVYPGVDLVYYGNQQQLEYDFVVAPGADPKPMRMHFAGARKLKLSADGDLTVAAKNGQITFHKPVVYQTKDGHRQPVEGSFALLAGNSIGFRLGAYDHSRELVVDPVLAYCTYLGGSGYELAKSIAVDAEGNAYVTGQSTSLDFPVTERAFQKSGGGISTIIVTKLNAAGSALLYSTYLGRGDSPYATPDIDAEAIAVDAAGEAYVAGGTGSADFPVTDGAFQTVYPASVQGARVGFVTKLNAAGSALVYSTYLGGSNEEFIAGIAVDAAGQAYVAGETYSIDFPITSGAVQTSPGLSFVTKFNAAGSGLIYSTYFGGEEAFTRAIAVDGLGQTYLTGGVYGDGIPVTSGAFQKLNNQLPYTNSNGPGEPYTGFVTKLSSTGSALVYSTFLGGSNNERADELGGGGEEGNAISVDTEGNAYVTGATSSTDFPVTNGAFQTALNGPYSGVFVTKLNPTGSALVYSTYLGDGYDNVGQSIAVDASSRAVLEGYAFPGFPLTPDAYQGSQPEFTSFLTMLNATGSALVYSTFFGTEGGTNGMALDGSGNAYLAGANETQLLTTPGAYQPTVHDATSVGSNAFVAKFAFNGATTTILTSGANPQISGENVNFSAHVEPIEGIDVPSGDVAFIVDGVVADHATLDGDGDATFTTDSLTVGQHTIVASYLGDPKNFSASSGVVTQTITGQVSAPTFNPPGGTFQVPTPVVIESASPGATIYYTTDGSMPSTSKTMYTAPLKISATTTIKAIAVETASGDTQSAIATATFAMVPAAIATNVSILSSLNPSSAGQSVTFTATVTAASGPTPTGSVIFKHRSTIIGSAPLIDGTAQITTSSLAPEVYEVLAVYTGSPTDANSHSPTVVQVVNPQ